MMALQKLTARGVLQTYLPTDSFRHGQSLDNETLKVMRDSLIVKSGVAFLSW